MIIAFLSAGFIVLLIVVVTLGIRCKNLEKWLMKSIEAGEELQERANENDLALRQGLEDQADAYEQDFLTFQETIEGLRTSLEGSREAFSRFVNKTIELEAQHKGHQDHCLPILAEMREEIS